MARRKTNHELLEDIFADMDHDEQGETLRVLTRLHSIADRKTRRNARRGDTLELRGSGSGTVTAPAVNKTEEK